jgi:hypothetical protein
MLRKMRVEYPGALYHVMSRGDQRDDMFFDDVDRHDCIKTLALSGRYKAQLVEGRGNGYLRTACDYVHWNPIRARLPGGSAWESPRTLRAIATNG